MDISLLLSAARSVPNALADHHAAMTTSPTSIQQFASADDILHRQIEAAANKLEHHVVGPSSPAVHRHYSNLPTPTLPSAAVATRPTSQKVEIGADGKAKRFECDVPGCDSKFGQKGSLTRHMKSRHEKRRPHACHLCHKSFSEKWTLNVHLRNVHEKRKPHKCTLCKKSFGERWNLRKHINVVHKNIKPYSCEICSRAFGYKGDMRKHVMELHVQEGRPFQCTVASCGVKFARMRYLRRHQNLTHRPPSTSSAPVTPSISAAAVASDSNVVAAPSVAMSTAPNSAATSLESFSTSLPVSRASSMDGGGAYTALQTLSMYASSVREAQISAPQR